MMKQSSLLMMKSRWNFLSRWSWGKVKFSRLRNRRKPNSSNYNPLKKKDMNQNQQHRLHLMKEKRKRKKSNRKERKKVNSTWKLTMVPTNWPDFTRLRTLRKKKIKFFTLLTEKAPQRKKSFQLNVVSSTFLACVKPSLTGFQAYTFHLFHQRK
jgi:hypothetical protein